MISFSLSQPTSFPDLNKQENKDAEFNREEIQLSPLKYKHFRAALKYPEEDQMHHLMMAMTGLSEDDIGEFSPNDAAGISKIIFESMRKYMELGQQILKGMDKR